MRLWRHATSAAMSTAVIPLLHHGANLSTNLGPSLGQATGGNLGWRQVPIQPRVSPKPPSPFRKQGQVVATLLVESEYHPPSKSPRPFLSLPGPLLLTCNSPCAPSLPESPLPAAPSHSPTHAVLSTGG